MRALFSRHGHRQGSSQSEGKVNRGQRIALSTGHAYATGGTTQCDPCDPGGTGYPDVQVGTGERGQVTEQRDKTVIQTL